MLRVGFLMLHAMLVSVNVDSKARSSTRESMITQKLRIGDYFELARLRGTDVATIICTNQIEPYHGEVTGIDRLAQKVFQNQGDRLINRQ